MNGGDPRLAAASERLRGRPGRPKKIDPGLSALEGPARGIDRIGAAVRRLLDVAGAAEYLSVSPWTVRDLETAGVLSRVRIPLPNGGELRRALYDRADLDRLISAWKDGAR